MQNINQELTDKLAGELRGVKCREVAVALDFDGVCKLFTAHKHQIMSTLLFLHLRKFQQASLPVYKKAYNFINFVSKGYAGKARFLCVNALADHLAENGIDCRYPEIAAAIKELEGRGCKVNAAALEEFSESEEVAKILAWSKEVDERVGQLTEIGLTPGVKENIFDAFRGKVDFFVVSTATETSIKAALENEDIPEISRFIGQETASKAEALTALRNAGYSRVFMFGDSVEDRRACDAAAVAEAPAKLFFIPVIPEREEYSFTGGRKAIEADDGQAGKIAAQLLDEFAGNEVGTNW